MIEFFKRLFASEPKPKCGWCGSKDLIKGYYNRGWNNLCTQAYGDNGYFCNKCYKVSFITTLEEHKKTCPTWCTPCETDKIVIEK